MVSPVNLTPTFLKNREKEINSPFQGVIPAQKHFQKKSYFPYSLLHILPRQKTTYALPVTEDNEARLLGPIPISRRAFS